MARQKVLIIDQHIMVAQGLALLLKERFDALFVNTLPHAMQAVQKSSFALAVLAWDEAEHLACAKLLAALVGARLHTLVLAGKHNKAAERTIVALGARGFLYKAASFEQLQAAMQAVLAGHRSFPEQMLENLHVTDDDDIPPLTGREVSILNLLVFDPLINNDVIAHSLHISEGRVRNCLSEIYRKFKVNNRHELAHEALRRGYLPQACATPA